MCKVTGQTNLTYEEALVSEKHAAAKVHHFPKELMAPALRTIQYKNNQHKEEPIKYPIDDLLVKPSLEDPLFTYCPSPSIDFLVPLYCVGDLLMVWDFCSSFGKLLHLWPYSLEDFENAICHKDSKVVLLVESHATLFWLVIQDDNEYFSNGQNRK